MFLFLQEFQGIWLAAVGWFLAMAASSGLGQFQLRRRLQGYRVRDLMTASYLTVPLEISLETLATEHILRSRQNIYFVVQEDLCLGMITFKAMSRVPRNLWSTTTVAETMKPLVDIPSISPTVDAIQALEMIEERKFPIVLVKDGDELLGFVTQQGAIASMNILEGKADGRGA